MQILTYWSPVYANELDLAAVVAAICGSSFWLLAERKRPVDRPTPFSMEKKAQHLQRSSSCGRTNREKHSNFDWIVHLPQSSACLPPPQKKKEIFNIFCTNLRLDGNVLFLNFLKRKPSAVRCCQIFDKCGPEHKKNEWNWPKIERTPNSEAAVAPATRRVRQRTNGNGAIDFFFYFGAASKRKFCVTSRAPAVV